MATIKSYTSLEQSKKLAEILPIESADMWWCYFYDIISDTSEYGEEPILHKPSCAPELAIPCWSLAALFNVLPEGIIANHFVPNLQKENGKYSIAYGTGELLCVADNPVDACYEMILKLNEQKLL